MTTFSRAVANHNNVTSTTNGMAALKSSLNANVDLFYNIGSSRGNPKIVDAFVSAFKENADLAVRNLLHARDVRQGMGERKTFRTILEWLAKNEPDVAIRVLSRTPELGRWDDVINVLLVNDKVDEFVIELLSTGLRSNDSLCAKWMPRKGAVSVFLRNKLGMTPKQYRKTIVNLTKVVETDMCNNNWDSINFSHVPSVASSRYRKAFSRHTAKYTEWVTAVKSNLDNGIVATPDNKNVAKVNAKAIFPHDVIKGVNIYGKYAAIASDVITDMDNQWRSLPDYVGDNYVMPLVDVSGSMAMGQKNAPTPLIVATALGAYFADKNKGPFKDIFLNFSSRAEIRHIKGNNIVEKIRSMYNDNWGGSTNFEAAIKTILDLAVKNKVPANEMPKTLVILSDMQFNMCVTDYSQTALGMISSMYSNRGYEMPRLVFWNLNAVYGNNPVTFDQHGTALVSGFSQNLVEAVLSSDLADYTPESVMRKKLMSSRYDH